MWDIVKLHSEATAKIHLVLKSVIYKFNFASSGNRQDTFNGENSRKTGVGMVVDADNR